MPRPGSGIFHPLWEEHVRPTAATQALSQAIVERRSLTGVFDPETGQTTYPLETLHIGPARFLKLTKDAQQAEFAGQKIVQYDYRVTFPWPGPPDLRFDDIITCTVDEDPFLQGKRMRVEEIGSGTLMWQRDVWCVLNDAIGAQNG